MIGNLVRGIRNMVAPSHPNIHRLTDEEVEQLARLQAKLNAPEPEPAPRSLIDQMLSDQMRAASRPDTISLCGRAQSHRKEYSRKIIVTTAAARMALPSLLGMAVGYPCCLAEA